MKGALEYSAILGQPLPVRISYAKSVGTMYSDYRVLIDVRALAGLPHLPRRRPTRRVSVPQWHRVQPEVLCVRLVVQLRVRRDTLAVQPQLSALRCARRCRPQWRRTGRRLWRGRTTAARSGCDAGTPRPTDYRRIPRDYPQRLVHRSSRRSPHRSRPPWSRTRWSAS